MQNAIIKKLKNLLAGEIDSECKVVYLLAESRKLLETYPPDPVPHALKIYCHWALHIDLDNPGTTRPFLERVDQFVATVFAGGNVDHQMFREFVFLETFRDQFKQFLNRYGIPTAICDEDPRWHLFLKHYAGVIEDGSLSYQDKAQTLTTIREVTFTKGQPTKNTYVPFQFSWEIALVDGRTLIVDIAAAAPNGKEIILHSLRWR